MNKDPMDLPIRRPSSQTTVHPGASSTRRVLLNEQQVTTLVDSGAKVTEGLVSISKDIVDIARINAQSRAEVAGIEARSRAVVDVLRAETDRVLASRKTIQSRAEAAALVIRTVMETIPELDHASRQLAIEKLSELVGQVVSTQDPSPAFRL
jgi:hypothetical protein